MTRCREKVGTYGIAALGQRIVELVENIPRFDVEKIRK
jgi:hypothetical protein